MSCGESREHVREILDIVERAWTEPSFSYDGTYQSFKNVAVVSKPYQKPTPPIRIAASTPVPSRRSAGAARRSSPRCGTPPGPPSPSRSAAITRPGRLPAIQATARSSSRRRPISPRPTSAPALNPGKHQAFLPRACKFAGRSRKAGRPRNPPLGACGASSSCAKSIMMIPCAPMPWSAAPTRLSNSFAPYRPNRLVRHLPSSIAVGSSRTTAC